MALGADATGDRRYGLAGAIGGRPDVDDECLERPGPQVVGPPPLDLVEQARVDTAVDHRRCAQRELALAVLGLGMRERLGQVPLADALELER